MGLFGSSKSGAELAIGKDLSAILPADAKPWYRTKHLLFLNFILLVPLFSSGTVGYDGSMMNGLQTLPQWQAYFNFPDASILGLMNAIYPVGKVSAVLPVTWLSDRYGRKLPMLIGFVLLLIGPALQGASQNLAMFVVSRFIIGVATVGIAQPSPIIITELAYPTHRGKVTALYNTFFYFGAIFAAWSTYGTFRLQSNWAWRIPSILQAGLPCIQLAIFWWLPESPRWLIAKGRIDEARKILADLHTGGDQSHPLIDYEMEEIEACIRVEREVTSQSSYRDLIRTAPNRRRTLIAIIVGFFAQWNGIGVVSYYLTLVLNTIGITTVDQQALINGLLQLFNFGVAVVGGAMMVDRLGRRTLFLISTGGLLCSYVCWTVLTSQFVATKNPTTGNAVVAFIFLAYFFYDIAWTPLLAAYPVEIFPYTLRGRGLSATLISTYIGLIIGQFLNPLALKAIGYYYYIVFCCLLAILLALVYFLFPETKGRTLEEIAEIFDGKKVAPTNLGRGSVSQAEEEKATEIRVADIN